jgi:hypothetical protein
MFELKDAIRNLVQFEARNRGRVPSYATVLRIVKDKEWDAQQSLLPLKWIIDDILKEVSSTFDINRAGRFIPYLTGSVSYPLLDGLYQEVPLNDEDLARANRLIELWTRLIRENGGYVGSNLLYKLFGGKRSKFAYLRRTLIEFGWFTQVEPPHLNVVARFNLGEFHPEFGSIKLVTRLGNSWDVACEEMEKPWRGRKSGMDSSQ